MEQWIRAQRVALTMDAPPITVTRRSRSLSATAGSHAHSRLPQEEGLIIYLRVLKGKRRGERAF
jgi:hypothetical protein